MIKFYFCFIFFHSSYYSIKNIFINNRNRLLALQVQSVRVNILFRKFSEHTLAFSILIMTKYILLQNSTCGNLFLQQSVWINLGIQLILSIACFVKESCHEMKTKCPFFYPSLESCVKINLYRKLAASDLEYLWK